MSAAALIALPLALLLPSPAPAQFAVAKAVRAAPPRLGLFGRFRQKRAVEAAWQSHLIQYLPLAEWGKSTPASPSYSPWG